MRRFTAASVLLVVLSLWGAPVLSALTSRSAEDRLPACCRRGGKHHCAMQMMMDSGWGPAFAAPPQHCPFYPKGVLPGPTRLSLFVPAQVAAFFFAAVQSHPAFAAQTEALYRIAFDRSRLKRGPPSLL